MNLCVSCGLDFTGVRDFDAHRVGRHVYTLGEGLHRVPPVEDGRRCLADWELVGRGWFHDRYGRWSAPNRFHSRPRMAA